MSEPVQRAQGDLGLIEFLIVLARRKRLVLWMPLAVALVTVAITLFMPNIYKASAKIMPPQVAQTNAAALLAQFGGGGGGGGKNSPDMYVSMLKSRTVADRLIERFKLKAVYQQDTLEKARVRLEENSTIIAGKDGLISIDVEDVDRKRATEMANAYTEELQRLTKEMAVTEASQRREFFGKQLEASKNNLAKAEADLKRALDTHGVVSVDSDSRALVETMSRLRAQAAAKEIQLASMRAFVTENNMEYRRAQEELAGMRSELSRLENGRPESAAARSPQGLDNIKVVREVKYHQMLYELLSKQYEVARLDEAREASSVQVMDQAVLPELKFKPRRALITLLAYFFALFLGVGAAYFLELKQRMLVDDGRAAQWATFKSLVSAKRTG